MIDIPDEEKRFDFRKSIGGVILSILIVIGIFTFIFRVDFHKAFENILQANLWLFSIAVGLYFIEVGFWTGRWWAALRSIEVKISYFGLYLICHGGKFITNVTPILKAGGDPFRAYFANKTYKISYDTGLGTLMAESAISVPVYLSFLAIGAIPWLYVNTPSFVTLISGIAIISMAIFFIPFVLWLVERKTALNFLSRILSWLSKKLRLNHSEETIVNSLEKLYKSIRFVIENKRAGLYMVLITIFLYMTTIIRFYIIFLALGESVAWYVPFLAATAPFLLGLIPFSPGGLIFVEGGMMILLTTMIGISPLTAESFVIVERSISYLVSTIAGGIAASYLGIEIWKK